MWTDSQRVLSWRGTISGGVARFPRAVPVVFSLFLVCTPTHARRCPRGYKLLRTVPGPLQKIHRCPLEIISAAGRRGFEQLRRLLFALFFLPRASLPLHRPPPPPTSSLPPPSLAHALFLPLLPSISSVNRLIVLVTGPRSTHATLAFLRRGPVQLFIATTFPSQTPTWSAPFWSFPFFFSFPSIHPDRPSSCFRSLSFVPSPCIPFFRVAKIEKIAD